MLASKKEGDKRKYFHRTSVIYVDVDPYRAVAEGDVRLLKLAMEDENFSINSQKWSGWTLLHRAAEIGRTDILQMLLDAGADPNIYSTWGWQTPLHMALGKGHLDAAVMLVEYGADQYKKNKYKQNPSMVANNRGFGSVVKQFKAEAMRRDIMRYKEKIEKSKQDFKENVMKNRNAFNSNDKS